MTIVEIVKEEVKKRCESPNNYFGPDVFNHIKSVAYHAVELASLNQCDEEVCELAAWLHDIASVTDYSLYKEHHLHGAVIAEDILQSYGYPIEKIELIKKCILNHRGSVSSERIQIEEICVADADAISHFDNLPSLFYLVYVQRKMSVGEGRKFIKEKLDRSFRKMSSNSRSFYTEKKNRVIEMLED